MDNDNIIDLFKKSSSYENRNNQKFFKGFPYIKIKKDEMGNRLKKDMLLDYASKCFYIISVVRDDNIGSALYKYKVPYSSLLDFLNEFKKNSSYGEIIDIERYIPEDLA